MQNINWILKLTLLFILVKSNVSFSQNLVPNPSFENYHLNTSWPYDAICDDWFNPNIGSPDYRTLIQSSTCQGYPPHNGNAYFGLFVFQANVGVTNPREYVYAQLDSPMVNDEVYIVSFYVRPYASFNDYFIKKVGAYLSVNDISQFSTTNTLLNYTPQVESNQILDDSTQWLLVSDTIVVAGGEKYITIGNFRDDANTDTIYNYTNSVHGIYYNSYYLFDDVSVIPMSTIGLNNSTTKENPLSIYPSPNNGVFTIKYFGTKRSSIKIYDALGSLIISDSMVAGKKDFDLSNLNKGVYIVVMDDGEGKTATQKFVVQN